MENLSFTPGFSPVTPRAENNQNRFQRSRGGWSGARFGRNHTAVCQKAKPLKRFHVSFRDVHHRAKAGVK